MRHKPARRRLSASIALAACTARLCQTDTLVSRATIGSVRRKTPNDWNRFINLKVTIKKFVTLCA